MRVLVTGHRGYVGSVLTAVLRHHRFEVFGLDCDLYRGCDFGRTHDPAPGFELDLRQVEFTDLLSFDAIVHLASLPEGLHGNEAKALLDEVNIQATIRLAECARRAQVGRFLFASSCAVYGRGGGWLDEESTPRPLTPYAQSKLTCEQALTELADESFRVLHLRNATVYGVSPRLRLDICVNDFVGAGVTRGRIVMQTAGRAWRPLIHVEDLCRAYALLLKAPDDVWSQQRVINVADEAANMRIIDLADAVSEEIPQCARVPVEDVLDVRSYRVRTQRLHSMLPSFTCRWTLRHGIRQLRMAMTAAGLTLSDWRSDRFRRAARLESLIEHGEPIGPAVRRSVSA